MICSEEEKKAIETLKEIIKHKKDFDFAYGAKIESPYNIGHSELEELDIILNLIQKQEKIINAMAEQLTAPIHSKEWVIEYFKKNV